jgi:hypothetical protein
MPAKEYYVSSYLLTKLDHGLGNSQGMQIPGWQIERKGYAQKDLTHCYHAKICMSFDDRLAIKGAGQSKSSSFVRHLLGSQGTLTGQNTFRVR